MAIVRSMNWSYTHKHTKFTFVLTFHPDWISSSNFLTFLSLQICSNFHWISPDFFTIPDSIILNWMLDLAQHGIEHKDHRYLQYLHILLILDPLTTTSMASAGLPVITNYPMLPSPRAVIHNRSIKVSYYLLADTDIFRKVMFQNKRNERFWIYLKCKPF